MYYCLKYTRMWCVTHLAFRVITSVRCDQRLPFNNTSATTSLYECNLIKYLASHNAEVVVVVAIYALTEYNWEFNEIHLKIKCCSAVAWIESIEVEHIRLRLLTNYHISDISLNQELFSTKTLNLALTMAENTKY